MEQYLRLGSDELKPIIPSFELMTAITNQKLSAFVDILWCDPSLIHSLFKYQDQMITLLGITIKQNWIIGAQIVAFFGGRSILSLVPETALNLAISSGNLELVTFFSELEPWTINLSWKDTTTIQFRSTIESPLALAAKFGRMDMMQSLIPHIQNIDSLIATHNTPNQKSPFYYAIESGNVEMVRLILTTIGPIETGRIINREFPSQLYPIHLAIRSGSTSMVTYLVSQGAILNLPNSYGDSPLLMATYRKDILMAECILQLQIAQLRTLRSKLRSFEELIGMQFEINLIPFINSPNSQRMTPIEHGIGRNKLKLITLFLQFEPQLLSARNFWLKPRSRMEAMLGRFQRVPGMEPDEESLNFQYRVYFESSMVSRLLMWI